jgi:predicted phosphodiesterase
MTTNLILADLHYGFPGLTDDRPTTEYVRKVVSEEEPDEITLLGDSFHLGHYGDQRQHLRDLLQQNTIWCDLRDRNELEKIRFVIGEEDWKLQQPEIQEILCDYFSEERVDVVDAYYDPVSKTLLAHGHQLDQSRLYEINGEQASLFQRTMPPLKELLRGSDEAIERGTFSSWWEYPTLGNYIKIGAELFGGDLENYLTNLAGVFQSNFYKTWLNHQDLNGKVVGSIARVVSHKPDLLLRAYSLFHMYAEFILQKRRRAVLRQEPWRHAPQELFQGPVENLVLAHRHFPEVKEFPEGTFYSLPAPGRVHTGRIENGVVETNRYYGHVVISEDEINFIEFKQEREIKKIN